MGRQAMLGLSKRGPPGTFHIPNLFAIYLSRVFSAVENQVPGLIATSFADNFGFMVETRSISAIAAHVGIHQLWVLIR